MSNNIDFKNVCKDTVNNYGHEIRTAHKEERLIEYLDESILEYEFTVDCHKEYKAARAYLTIGGPCVYIECGRYDGVEIVLIWGQEKASYYLPPAIGSDIIAYMKDLFYC